MLKGHRLELKATTSPHCIDYAMAIDSVQTQMACGGQINHDSDGLKGQRV